MPPLDALLWGNLGIALAAASAATINHVLDRRIDAQMSRTRGRPLPTGGLTERQALIFAAVLGVASMPLLACLVNPLTAVLTFASLIGYAMIYTLWLKRATLAEHRHRRRRRRRPAGAGLDRRDRQSIRTRCCCS